MKKSGLNMILAASAIAAISTPPLHAGPAAKYRLDIQVMELPVQEADRIESVMQSAPTPAEFERKRVVWGSTLRPVWKISSEAAAWTRTLAGDEKKSVPSFPKGVNTRTFRGGEVEVGNDVEWEIRPREDSDALTLLLALRMRSVRTGPVFDGVEVTTEFAAQLRETVRVFRQDIGGRALVGYARISGANNGTTNGDPVASATVGGGGLRYSIHAGAFRVDRVPLEISSDPARLAEWAKSNGKLLLSTSFATQSGRRALAKIGQEEYFEVEKNCFAKDLTAGMELVSALMASAEGDKISLGSADVKFAISGPGLSASERDFFKSGLLGVRGLNTQVSIGADYGVLCEGFPREGSAGPKQTDGVAPPVVVIFRVGRW